MLKFFLAYLGSLVAMAVIDLLWLVVIAKNLYQSKLGALLADDPKLGAAAAFYFLYPLGVIYFAVAPALASASLGQAALRGALLGFFAYMTYEFTNLALIRGWPSSLVAIDIVWGVALTTGVAMAGYAAGKWVG